MSKYDQRNNPYSWMPDFLRRFLNLDYDDSKSNEPSVAGRSASFTPASTSAVGATWSPPSEPTFKPSAMESYTPPTGGFTPSATTMAPPAPAPRPSSSDASASTVTPSVQFDGPIQPITFLVRAFARGVLPPQGIDAFTKELGATSTDVWNMYTHWARFQTQDVFRFGREVITTISNVLPAGSPQMSPARRIKVTIADGNGNVVPISSVASDDPKLATGADKAKH